MLSSTCWMCWLIDWITVGGVITMPAAWLFTMGLRLFAVGGLRFCRWGAAASQGGDAAVVHMVWLRLLLAKLQLLMAGLQLLMAHLQLLIGGATAGLRLLMFWLRLLTAKLQLLTTWLQLLVAGLWQLAGGIMLCLAQPAAIELQDGLVKPAKQRVLLPWQGRIGLHGGVRKRLLQPLLLPLPISVLLLPFCVSWPSPPPCIVHRHYERIFLPCIRVMASYLARLSQWRSSSW